MKTHILNSSSIELDPKNQFVEILIFLYVEILRVSHFIVELDNGEVTYRRSGAGFLLAALFHRQGHGLPVTDELLWGAVMDQWEFTDILFEWHIGQGQTIFSYSVCP